MIIFDLYKPIINGNVAYFRITQHEEGSGELGLLVLIDSRPFVSMSEMTTLIMVTKSDKVVEEFIMREANEINKAWSNVIIVT